MAKSQCKKNWYTEKEAAKALRKKGKALTVPPDGRTSNGNNRWSRQRLSEAQ